MRKVLGRFFIKLRNFANSCIDAQNRELFFTDKSIVDSSFKLGSNNFLDISDDAEFRFGKNVTINHSNFITVKNNAKFSIGDGTYITRATISCLGEIEIGENCILGEGMKIFDHNHQYTKEPFSVSKTDFNIGKVKIGNNVWTGTNVIILKDVTIGDNVILGAGCVIHKDVPSNSIIINKQDQKNISLNN
ncbi:transferase hexapeptide (six repeat-containing protein) [Chryseobacterium formosense]|uniref:acyltransferase n=1 Tax=Chryseobacterium formosense TaxID=236814 RepID=UPI00068C9168|nr:acyltransferase [Chryseobacterium formosense]SFT56146.1 transferase hexapeptide (six repeat-containing protein) [Chryseobacterium formosense]